MPDATGLELLAQRLRETEADSVLDTVYFRDQAAIVARPERIRLVLHYLRGAGYSSLASLHGVDYYPDEPRLGVQYELLDMAAVDRIAVKTRVSTDDPELDSVVDIFPSADYQEREVYDMFGVRFRGHHDLRRILMPDDYEGYPQRRDFPLGGEPVIFTHNEDQFPGWWK